MAVWVHNRLRRTRVHDSRLQRLAHRVLAAAGEPSSELSLELVGDHRMRQLNRRYRNRNAATDVLAFATREANGPASPLLGDVVISFDTAARQAAAQGHAVEREVAVLLVHGVLHLCGYDHEGSAREARLMREKERAILRSLGRIPKLFRYRAP